MVGRLGPPGPAAMDLVVMESRNAAECVIIQWLFMDPKPSVQVNQHKLRNVTQSASVSKNNLNYELLQISRIFVI